MPARKVLDVLLELFNSQHTALQKTVSHKTRYDRAQFLRRFFRDLHERAGFKLLPDPRNLGQKHLRAMVTANAVATRSLWPQLTRTDLRDLGGAVTKFEANLAAIEVLRQIEAEHLPNVGADLNLTHPADPILTRGWKPTV